MTSKTGMQSNQLISTLASLDSLEFQYHNFCPLIFMSYTVLYTTTFCMRAFLGHIRFYRLLGGATGGMRWKGGVVGWVVNLGGWGGGVIVRGRGRLSGGGFQPIRTALYAMSLCLLNSFALVV